jgi:epsilon-lactone hydrolase
MREKIESLRALRAAAAAQPAPTLAENRASFDARGDLYPVPGDVLVAEADADGVPAYWLTAPGADARRVLLYLHGGGYQVGSLRSHAELASRLGRATLRIAEGLPHVYPGMLGTPEAAEATEQAGAFLRGRT